MIRALAIGILALSSLTARAAEEDPTPETGWTLIPVKLESKHPYDHQMDIWREIGRGGATAIRLHFAYVRTEERYDWVRVLDLNQRLVGEWTGDVEPFWTDEAEGDRVRLNFKSDYGNASDGYVIDQIAVRYPAASPE